MLKLFTLVMEKMSPNKELLVGGMAIGKKIPPTDTQTALAIVAVVMVVAGSSGTS
jgi:hypothetical protein